MIKLKKKNSTDDLKESTVTILVTFGYHIIIYDNNTGNINIL